MNGALLRTLAATLCLALSVFACGGSTTENGDLPTQDQGSDSDGTSDVGQEPTGPTPRQVHRFTVAQLIQSIPVITGGIGWEEDFGEGPLDMLEILAPTLGAPDYILVTEENMEPSMIIAKFMQDAAYRVCTKWVQRDQALPPGERTLIQHDDWFSTDSGDVRGSIRALLFRVFAHNIESVDDPAIEPYWQLFQTGADLDGVTPAPSDGWLAVCIALMTHPEFILY
jgi:hypothetical protein